MDEAEELPLGVDFGAAAQGEATEALVVMKIAEDRRDSGEALPITLATFGAVDMFFHAVGVRRGAVGRCAEEEGDLSGLGFVGMT